MESCELKAEVSSSHGVSQFVLVPKERHEAHVGLNGKLLIEHQDAVGLPGNRPQGVDLLRRVLQLLTKRVDLWMRARARDITVNTSSAQLSGINPSDVSSNHHG